MCRTLPTELSRPMLMVSLYCPLLCWGGGGGTTVYCSVARDHTSIKTPYNLGSGSQGITFEGDSTFYFRFLHYTTQRQLIGSFFKNNLGWTKEYLIEWDSNQWPPDKHAGALPTELSSPMLTIPWLPHPRYRNFGVIPGYTTAVNDCMASDQQPLNKDIDKIEKQPTKGYIAQLVERRHVNTELIGLSPILSM